MVKTMILSIQYRVLSKFLFLILASQSLYAQNSFDLPENNRVIINYGDHVVYATVKTDGRKPKPKNKYVYFWYNANEYFEECFWKPRG